MAKSSPKARKRAKRPSATPAQTQKVAPESNQGPAERSLNARQERFILEYLKDVNATQAAIRAGYSAKTANRIGARLLTNVVISAAVEQGKAARLKRLELDGDLYLGILHNLCTYDVGKCLDTQGNFLPVGEWPEPERLALSGVETIIKNAKAGDGVVDEVLKARYSDRRASVELMLRHLGLLVDRKEVGKPGEFDQMSLEQIDAELARLRSKRR